MQTNQPHSAPLLHSPAPLMHSIERAMALTGFSRNKVYNALNAGKLEAVKAGRRTLILDTSLRQWIASLPRYAA
ncbi:MAG: DNA-binding protein [Proteobacteria bacterium]|nr:MAG: DNA-binding protein [Pseudomonadota bacterium]